MAIEINPNATGKITTTGIVATSAAVKTAAVSVKSVQTTGNKAVTKQSQTTQSSVNAVDGILNGWATSENGNVQQGIAETQQAINQNINTASQAGNDAVNKAKSTTTNYAGLSATTGKGALLGTSNTVNNATNNSTSDVSKLLGDIKSFITGKISGLTGLPGELYTDLTKFAAGALKDLFMLPVNQLVDAVFGVFFKEVE